MRWPESAAAAGLPAAGVAARDVLSPAHAAPAGTGRSNGNVVLALGAAAGGVPVHAAAAPAVQHMHGAATSGPFIDFASSGAAEAERLAPARTTHSPVGNGRLPAGGGPRAHRILFLR